MGLQGARASPTTGAKLLTLSSSCQTFSFTRQVAQNSGGKKKGVAKPTSPSLLQSTHLLGKRLPPLVATITSSHLSSTFHSLKLAKKKNNKKQKSKRHVTPLLLEGRDSCPHVLGLVGKKVGFLQDSGVGFLKKKKHTTATRSVGIKRSCCLSSREPVESSAPLPSYR